MNLSDLDRLADLKRRRADLARRIAEAPQMVTRAVEMRSPSGVVVLSNDQPGAQWPMSEEMDAAIRQAVISGLHAELAANEAAITALGVTVDAAS